MVMVFFGKKKEKVFCNECRYMVMKKIVPIFLVERQDVAHCRNEMTSINTYDLDTPLKRGAGKLLTTEAQQCSKLNQNNDCIWFKSKK